MIRFLVLVAALAAVVAYAYLTNPVPRTPSLPGPTMLGQTPPTNRPSLTRYATRGDTP